MRFTRYILQQAKATTSRSATKDVFLKISEDDILIKSATGNPTGITGIWQHPNPRPALIKVYDHTLSLLSTKFPSESVYRQSVENLTKARKQIVEENEVEEVIEQKIGAGLIEEILEQAAEEFRLAEYLADQKPWEELADKPLEDQWKYFDRPE